jgi:hypothetical protein
MASKTGVIMIAGQKIVLGRIHARRIVTVHVAADTITIDFGEDTRIVRRTTTQPVLVLVRFLAAIASRTGDRGRPDPSGANRRLQAMNSRQHGCRTSR